MGMDYRKVWLSCVLPEGHGLRMNGVFTPLPEIFCDLCASAITGEICHAVSQWRHEDHTCEMVEWESEYGNVLTDEQVALHDKLTGKEAAK